MAVTHSTPPAGAVKRTPSTQYKTLIEWCVVCFVCISITLWTSHNDWLWKINISIYDHALKHKTFPVSQHSTLVTIDQRSLNALGKWPWPRDIHATLVNRLRLAGAKTIVFNVLLIDQKETLSVENQTLANAITQHGNVILPIAENKDASSPGAGHPVLLPTPVLLQAATAIGHIHAEIDQDGIVRTISPWKTLGAAAYPQLALAAFQTQGVRTAPAYNVAFDSSDKALMYIPFTRQPERFPSLSYVDIVNGNFTAESIAGRTLFIGVTATGLGDLVPVPTSGINGLMPGIMVHATIYDALADQTIIQRLPNLLTMMINAGLVLLLLIIMLRTKPRAALLVALLMIVSILAISWSLMFFALIWWPGAAAILGCLLAYPLWSWRRLEASNRYFDQEISQLQQDNLTSEQDSDHSLDKTTIDPYMSRIADTQYAAQRFRELRLMREQTMHFLSHDLRAPLAAIISMLESTRQQPLPLDKTETLKIMDRCNRCAQSALSMADNLIRLVRAQDMNQDQLCPVSLQMLMQDAADDAWPLAKKAEITFKTDFSLPDDNEDATILADPDLIRRAILNLLTNAVKYTPADGDVSLTLQSRAQEWIVEVRDTGPGIAEDQQKQLFHYLSRLQVKENSHTEGVGLGLLMVKTVMDRHNGKVSLKSQPGHGSIFCLHFPHYTTQQNPSLAAEAHRTDLD